MGAQPDRRDVLAQIAIRALAAAAAIVMTRGAALQAPDATRWTRGRGTARPVLGGTIWRAPSLDAAKQRLLSVLEGFVQTMIPAPTALGTGFRYAAGRLATFPIKGGLR